MGGGAGALIAKGRPAPLAAPKRFACAFGGTEPPLPLTGGCSSGDTCPRGGSGSIPGEEEDDAPGEMPVPRGGSDAGVAAPDLAGDCDDDTPKREVHRIEPIPSSRGALLAGEMVIKIAWVQHRCS